MQWNGVRPNPDRPAPLRSLMEILQQKAEPYVTEYGENQLPGVGGRLYNSIMRTGTEMVPGVGDLLGVEDLQTAAQNNDWAGIGLGALAAIPGIPAIGRGVRGEARAARGAGGAGADAMESAGYRVERSQDLAPTDTPESLRAQGYEIDPATNTWARTVATEAPPVDYPIRAYHGSPHSFDQFSLDKIGTGEGAQAYGHGLYFAGNEDVARGYRDALQTKRVGIDGVPLEPSDPRFSAANSIAARGYEASRQTLTDALESGFVNRESVLRDIAALDALQGVKIDDVPTGSMYEVGINADPNTFLDWDRPLSEQPENVMSALRNTLGGSGVDLPNGVVQLENGRWATAVDGVPIGRPQGWPNQSTAEQALRYANEDGQYLYGTAGSILQRQRNQPEISAALAAQGVPGIRYLDRNSRGVGEGSSNYVVFNDELVKILRKYGISGLSTTVGASALAEELDRRGQTQEF